MAKLLSIGEIVWDVFPDKEIIGGAPFNLAAHTCALGGAAFILSRVGCDRRGAAAAEQVRAKGVDGKYLQTDPERPNGISVITLTGTSAAYDIPFGASHDYIAADGGLTAKLNAEKFDIICYGTLVQRGEVSRETVRTVLDGVGAKHRFLDVNLRMGFHDADVLEYSLSKATVVKLNEEECAVISMTLFGAVMSSGDFAAEVIDRYGAEHVLITLGAEGCAVFSEDRRELIPAPRVLVADTVGAGDAFSAGFIYSLLRGGDAFGAARFGNAMGAFTASRDGATPPLDRAELIRLGAEL